MLEKSATKRVAKNAFWLFSGNAVAKVLEFAAIVYLARVLTVSGFGLYSFGQAILIYLLIVVDGGLSFLGIREIAKNGSQASGVVANLLSLRFLLASMIFLVSLLVILIVKINFDLKLFFILTFLLVFQRALTPEWIFQGFERMEFIGAIRIMQQSIFFILVLMLVKGLNNLASAALLQFITYLAVSLVFLTVLFRNFISFNIQAIRPKAWYPYLIETVPLGLSFVFIQIYYNLDMIMLGFMKSPEVVGWYNAAYKLFFVFLGALGAFSAAVFPTVCRKFELGREGAGLFLEKYLHLLMLAAIPTVLLGWLCAEPGLKLIYGESYLPGSLAFQILLLTILIISVSSIYGGLVLVPAGRNKEFMCSVGLGALCNVVLNMILIPAYSLVGAAVATLITEVIVALAFYYWGRREVLINWTKYLLNPGLASLIAFLPAVWLYRRFYDSNWLLLLVLTSFIFIYSAIIALTSERLFLSDFLNEIIRERK